MRGGRRLEAGLVARAWHSLAVRVQWMERCVSAHHSRLVSQTNAGHCSLQPKWQPRASQPWGLLRRTAAIAAQAAGLQTMQQLACSTLAASQQAHWQTQHPTAFAAAEVAPAPCQLTHRAMPPASHRMCIAALLTGAAPAPLLPITCRNGGRNKHGRGHVKRVRCESSAAMVRMATAVLRAAAATALWWMWWMCLMNALCQAAGSAGAACSESSVAMVRAMFITGRSLCMRQAPNTPHAP